MSGQNICHCHYKYQVGTLAIITATEYRVGTLAIITATEYQVGTFAIITTSECWVGTFAILTMSGWNTCHHHCQWTLGQTICHQCHCRVRTHFNGLHKHKCHKLSLAIHLAIIASLLFPSLWFLVPIMFLNELQNRLITNWCWFLSWVAGRPPERKFKICKAFNV